jgi:hypothetical protein
VPRARFTLGDHRIAAVGCRLSTGAAKWVATQIAGGQTVAHLARELDCGWDAINARDSNLKKVVGMFQASESNASPSSRFPDRGRSLPLV